MTRSIIVAKADNNAIGVKGDLPWHISEDLKFFKRTTLGCPVIMGRTTFNSLGRPLPGRLNIVLTRSSESTFPDGVRSAASLEEAYKIAESSNTTDQYFVIGGASVYKEALPSADKLYITEVHTSLDYADAFFPEIIRDQWKEISRSETYTDAETGYTFEFVEYTRK